MNRLEVNGSEKSLVWGVETCNQLKQFGMITNVNDIFRHRIVVTLTPKVTQTTIV